MKLILIVLVLVACTHTAPVVAPANHAIEFIALLDKSVRCEDWRAFGSPVHSAMCASGDSLLTDDGTVPRPTAQTSSISAPGSRRTE